MRSPAFLTIVCLLLALFGAAIIALTMGAAGIPLSRLPAARTCSCKDALATAIVTRAEHVPAQTKKDLEPIIGKYMK